MGSHERPHFPLSRNGFQQFFDTDDVDGARQIVGQLDKVKPKQDAAQAAKPKFDPSTGRSAGEMPGAPGGYTGSPLPSSNAPSSMPGGLGSDGPSLPSAGSLGGAPGSNGGSGGGLLGGRRR